MKTLQLSERTKELFSFLKQNVGIRDECSRLGHKLNRMVHQQASNDAARFYYTNNARAGLNRCSLVYVNIRTGKLHFREIPKLGK